MPERRKAFIDNVRTIPSLKQQYIWFVVDPHIRWWNLGLSSPFLDLNLTKVDFSSVNSPSILEKTGESQIYTDAGGMEGGITFTIAGMHARGLGMEMR